MGHLQVEHFLREVNHTIDNVMILLSTRSRVTSIKFIYLKLITVVVELKCHMSYVHNRHITMQKQRFNSGLPH